MKGYTLEKALELARKFCGINDCRPQVQNPCVYADCICATDGHVAVRIKLPPGTCGAGEFADFAVRISLTIDECRRDAYGPFRIIRPTALAHLMVAAEREARKLAWDNYREAISVKCPHCAAEFKVDGDGDVVDCPANLSIDPPRVDCVINFPGDPAPFNWELIDRILAEFPDALWYYKKLSEGIYGPCYQLHAEAGDGAVQFAVMGLRVPRNETEKFTRVEVQSPNRSTKENERNNRP